jgi:hypothetical protein
MLQQGQVFQLTTRSPDGERLSAYRYRADRLPADDSPLLFPGDRGGYLDINYFRPFQWRPAQLAAGITLLRRIYDLRHTFATFALRAGISTFDLSRYMGATLTMIDRHYGHLARDGREPVIELLDALNVPEFSPWTLVDAAWTSKHEMASTLTTETVAKQAGRSPQPIRSASSTMIPSGPRT